MAERAVPRDEYRQVLARLEVVEHDVADVKVEQRELRREIGEFLREVIERFERMNERFDQMYNGMLVQTRWVVGSIAIFGSLITVLLAVSRFSS